jgi:hypothetical protein
MALGGAITLLFLGVIISYALTAAGAALFVIAVVGWIGELRHDAAHPDGHGHDDVH